MAINLTEAQVNEIVDTVQTADHGADRAVQIQFGSLLTDPDGRNRQVGTLFPGHVEHIGRCVAADQLIALLGQLAGQSARAAAQLQHKAVMDAVFPQ